MIIKLAIAYLQIFGVNSKEKETSTREKAYFYLKIKYFLYFFMSLTTYNTYYKGQDTEQNCLHQGTFRRESPVLGTLLPFF
jgi:hypothetical protein